MKPDQIDHFNNFSSQEAQSKDHQADGKPANLRPFRILISLLDKPEIGSAILEDVLIDVFKHMYLECEGVSSSQLEESTSENVIPTLRHPLKGRLVSNFIHIPQCRHSYPALSLFLLYILQDDLSSNLLLSVRIGA